MNLEEIFLITFTLRSNNLDYDNYDNPKLEMAKILSDKKSNIYLESVYDQILDIPSMPMKESIISFLFKNFIINCDDTNKKAFYIRMNNEIASKTFFNNKEFAYLLLNTYYQSVLKDYKLSNNKEYTNDNNYLVISLNNKLKESFINIIDDFVSKATDIYLIYDVLKGIIFNNMPIKNEELLDCGKDIELLRTYRKYFIKLMTYEIYEDIMFSKSDVSKLYNDALWIDDNDDENDFFDDPGYEIDGEDIFFDEIITSSIEDNAVYNNLPDEFYNDMLCIYQELIETPEKQRTNREYMKRNHQKVLKRSNPLYAFDEI